MFDVNAHIRVDGQTLRNFIIVRHHRVYQLHKSYQTPTNELFPDISYFMFVTNHKAQYGLLCWIFHLITKRIVM